MNSSCSRTCKFGTPTFSGPPRLEVVHILRLTIILLMLSSHANLLAQTRSAAAPASSAALPPATSLAPEKEPPGRIGGKWSNLPPPPRQGQIPGNQTMVRPPFNPVPQTIANNLAPLSASNALDIGFPQLPSMAGTTDSLPQPLSSTTNPPPTLPPAAGPSGLLERQPASGLLVSSSGSNTTDPLREESQEFNEGDLIAVVGTEHVLAGDMMIFIEPIIDQNRGRISPAQEKQLRAVLIRQVLSQYVQIKALYQEFFRDMSGNKPPKEMESMRSQVTTKAGQIFFEKQVPQMMKKYKVNDAASLERVLREKSMSVSAYRTQFIERILSSELERKYVPEEYEFSREELLGYYQSHPEEWTVTGRARWRELCSRFSNHSREEAERLIRDMGNEVYLGGRPFEAVAKNTSEGFTAVAGGVYDWTNQGSLKSTALDTAIFSLPLRRLSLVIEDETGFHIIEVLEREDGHTKSFDLAQVEIRKSLTEEKKSKLLKEFHTKVMARTSVWTKWPEDIPGSRDLAEALGK